MSSTPDTALERNGLNILIDWNILEKGKLFRVSDFGKYEGGNPVETLEVRTTCGSFWIEPPVPLIIKRLNYTSKLSIQTEKQYPIPNWIKYPKLGIGKNPIGDYIPN